MHPILFELAGVPVPAYSGALALGFVAGIALAARRARARGLDAGAVVDVGIAVFLASLVGARVLFVATHLEVFGPPTGSWSAVWNPFAREAGRAGLVGLSMLGGVAAAVAAALAVLRAKRLPFLAYADVMAPSVLLGEAITRVGCFLNGCCFGTACAWPWAVSFPPGSAAFEALGGAPLHPAQLYSAALAFGGFVLLSGLLRGSRARGTVFFSLLVVLATARIGLDFVRHQDAATLWAIAGVHVTVSQTIAALGWVAGLVGLARVGGRPRAAA